MESSSYGLARWPSPRGVGTSLGREDDGSLGEDGNEAKIGPSKWQLTYFTVFLHFFCS